MEGGRRLRRTEFCGPSVRERPQALEMCAYISLVRDFMQRRHPCRTDISERRPLHRDVCLPFSV